MPTNEKEYNGYLFDQLTLLERIERKLQKCDAEEVKEVQEEINLMKNEINRKLYQQPPLVEDRGR